ASSGRIQVGRSCGRQTGRRCGWSGPRRRPGGRSLVPDLDLVTVQIAHVRVREAWRELPSAEEGATGALHLLDGQGDVRGGDQPEAEMAHSTWCSGAALALLESEHVVRPGPLDLNARLVPEILLCPEDLLVEPGRPLRIANRKADVRETVRPDHGRPLTF